MNRPLTLHNRNPRRGTRRVSSRLILRDRPLRPPIQRITLLNSLISTPSRLHNTSLNQLSQKHLYLIELSPVILVPLW